MTTTTIEPGITVEDLPDTDADIPCEIEVGTPRRPCGQPAFCRVHVRCSCEDKAAFICRACLGLLAGGRVTCSRLVHIATFAGTL